MPRFFLTVLLHSVILLFGVTVAFAADNKHFASSHLSMTIPTGMAAAFHDEDNKLKLYRYLFTSGNGYDHNLKEMRVVIGDMVPVDKTNLDAWQADTLGSMIAIFADAHHISLESDSSALDQKPQSLQIGHQRFKSITLNFGELHVQFLSTTRGRFAYFFTLATDVKDAHKQAEAFNEMLGAVRSATYR